MMDDFKTTRGKLPKAIGNQAVRQKIDSESSFKTPEQIAATNIDSGAVQPSLASIDSGAVVSNDFKKPKKARRFQLHWPPTRRELIIEIIVLVLLIGGVTTLIVTHHPAKVVVVAATKKIVKAAAPAPTTVPSDLTGLPVSPSVNTLPITAVMVENSTFARPQSGLGQAGVVFEAMAEGGVTRFMALYQDTSPSNVGPIRSLRPYYLSWAMGFDAAIAHVGGSPEALTDVTSWNARDLDEFYNGSYYHRITTRDAPHNVYTGISTLNQLETSKGYTTSTYTSWPRKADAPSKNVTAGTINMTLSGPTYNVQYTYDATTNTYNRAEGGAPLMDANTNTQISPKVVIAIVVQESQGALDASDAYYSDYTVIGSGVADIFQDGTVTTGQWSKASNTAQILFTDAAGKPIKLNTGQTWITAITAPSNVSYTP